MSPESPRHDPTRTAAERSQDESWPPGARRAASSGRSDTESSTSADVTRRQLVQSIGAGAALLGGSSVLSGAAVGQSSQPGEVQIEGVEDWELTTERVDQSAVPDGPSVAFEDDAIVVTGGHVFSRTGCDTFAPTRLVHSPETSRLGVIVDAVPTDTEASRDDPQVCADALMPLAYELRVTTEEHTSDVVVEEAFTDDGRSYHPRFGTGEIDPPAEVADYELTVGPEVGPDDAAVLTPSDADAMKPSVTFDGDDVVVEGAMTYGSSTCDEIALDYLQRAHEVEGHVTVELDAQRKDTVMPGDGCTTDHVADWYRLELTGSGEPPIERCSVKENPPNDVQVVMVEERDADLELPEGVTDHRLALDLTSAADREADPSVTFDAGSDGGTVAIEGTMSSGSSSCGTLAVGDLEWIGEDSERHLLAQVEHTERDGDPPGCTDDDVTVDYRLELTVDALPGTVTAEEVDAGRDEVLRSVTEQRYGIGEHELPDGVTGFEFTRGGGDEADVEADPTVTASDSATEPTVTVEGTLTEGPCEVTVLSDVRWADDGRLAVTVDAVTEEGSLVDGQCPIGMPPVPRSYAVELSLATRPDAVTAEEQLDADGEPERSLTVPLEHRVELPDDVLGYSLSTDTGASEDEVAADPSVTVDPAALPPVVSVDGALTVSLCHETAVTDVRWEDDDQSHLAVTVTAVDEQGQPATPDDCPLEALPERIDYTAELRLESLPDVVTAEEHVVGGEPERSATVDLGSSTGCGDADTETVDGQTVCSVRDDGYYRDVTGDGTVGQGDVAEFFSKQHRDAWKRPELFDFSGNGDVTHGDVVELADYVALN